MTLTKDPNFEEKLTFYFYFYDEEFRWTLTGAVESLKICTFVESIAIVFELKRYRGVVLWKMTYGFKNDISNLVNLHTGSWK